MWQFFRVPFITTYANLRQCQKGLDVASKKAKKWDQLQTLTPDQKLWEIVRDSETPNPALWNNLDDVLGRYYRAADITRLPADIPAYQAWFASEVAPHIRRNAGYAKYTQFEDENYWNCSKADMRRIIDASPVPRWPYNPDDEDCDDFTTGFLSELSHRYRLNFGSHAWGYDAPLSHSVVSFYCSDGPVIIDITKSRSMWDHNSPLVPGYMTPENWYYYKG